MTGTYHGPYGPVEGQDVEKNMPLIIERVASAHYMLKTAPSDAQTAYLARTSLADALRLLGRTDLL